MNSSIPTPINVQTVGNTLVTSPMPMKRSSPIPIPKKKKTVVDSHVAKIEKKRMTEARSELMKRFECFL